MHGEPAVKKPTSSRLFYALRRHAGIIVLTLLAAPLIVAFTWQGTIASMGDDSVSYLVLARHFSGLPDDSFLREWVPFVGHFPPLFPLLLAGTGGAWNLFAAHGLVAAFAILSLPLAYAYSARVLHRNGAALGVVILFLLAPAAWVGIKGILSESLFLFVSLAALIFHEARLASGRARTFEWLLFGVLLACVYLTRVIGVALVMAYAVCAVMEMRRAKRWNPCALLPFVPVVLLAGLWAALRPTGDSDTYRQTTVWMIGQWLADPLAQMRDAVWFLASGWLASFNGGADVARLPTVAFCVLGLLGLAGAVLRAREMRLDGWYVLLSLAVISFWVFPEDNMRRLLYPLVPLLILLAAHALLALCALLRAQAHGAKVLLAAAALAAVLCVPPALLVLAKARDTQPLLEGFDYSYSGMTEYYTTINLDRARADAAKHAAILSGFEALARLTPPGSRVMWMRPEYVALLGNREGVPWLYSWDQRQLATQVKRTGTTFLVVPGLFKADLTDTVQPGERAVTMLFVVNFSEPVFRLKNAATGRDEFILMQVDRAKLDALLASSP